MKKTTTKKTAVKIKKKSTEKKSKKEKPKTTLKTAGKIKETKKVKAKTKKKKTPLKTTKKVETKKPTGKPKKKVEVKKKEVKVTVKKKEKPKKKEVKKAVEKIKERPKKEAKKITVKVKEKIAPSVIKKVKPRKIIEKPEKEIKAKEVPLPRKVLAKKPVKAVLPVERKPEKVSRPVTEEKYPPGLVEILPKGYGEENIILMIVDPVKLFAYWEVLEETIESHKGILSLRVYDVTGVDFDGTNANSYSDITVHERIGSWYVDVSPEREFVVDIGFISPAGVFVTVARSNKVSTPRRVVAEEGVMPELYETGLRMGYE